MAKPALELNTLPERVENILRAVGQRNAASLVSYEPDIMFGTIHGKRVFLVDRDDISYTAQVLSLNKIMEEHPKQFSITENRDSHYTVVTPRMFLALAITGGRCTVFDEAAIPHIPQRLWLTEWSRGLKKFGGKQTYVRDFKDRIENLLYAGPFLNRS